MTKSDGAASELHLCNNLRHLFFALADVLGRGVPARVIYLEDDAELSNDMKARLARVCPGVTMTFTMDAEQIALFANLPRITPEILRRNLRLDLTRALRWALPLLQGQRFDVGYVYHPGLFTAKPVAGTCAHVVMRESGLNNYVTLAVPPFKAIIRRLAGLPAHEQIWGEEPWINAIEVTQPDRLPAAIRHKARALSFATLLARLNVAQRDMLAGVFVSKIPLLETDKRRALLLTQPLEVVGLCTRPQKIDIYTQIAAALQAEGYVVYLKHHPAEQSYALSGTTLLQMDVPIEVWPLLQLPRFDLAVALCSASLSEGPSLFADRIVQLMAANAFHPEGVSLWCDDLPAGLSVLGDKAADHAIPM